MEKNNRSVRRHHVERLKSKRSKYWSKQGNSEKSLGMLASTPKPCSCWMCGNQRDIDGDPIRDKGMFQKLLMEE